MPADIQWGGLPMKWPGDEQRDAAQKRTRDSTTNGILNTARSATQTQPATRIPDKINSEPKQLVCGAERLATPNPQGLPHRSLSGPSLRQGWAEEAADGQLVWVEGSVEEMARRADSAVEGYFEIPQNLQAGHTSPLMATQADWARGAVSVIRCRLCPRTKFSKWDDFKRYCNCSETHPLSIHFCDHCGDYFARGDSHEWHRQHRPTECLHANPEGAEAKRIATQEKHDAFIARLEEYLITREEEIAMSFFKDDERLVSQLVKEAD